MKTRWKRITAWVFVSILFSLWAPLALAVNDKLSWTYIPFPIYSPETDWALTVSAIGSGRFGEAAPSNLVATAAWSQRGQKSLSANPNIYLENGWWLRGRLAVEDWPTDFFGVGNDTQTQDKEIYTAQAWELEGTTQRRVAKRIWMGPRWVMRDYDLRDIEEDGLLERTQPLGIEGGRVTGLGASVSYDSRNDVFAPDEGVLIGLQSTFHSAGIGSDFSYREWALDARQFASLRPNWVLAFHQHLRRTRGNVPFQELSQLGNVSPPVRLRGYITGRFRDRDSAAAQAELRFPIKRRLSGAAFVGAGAVSSSLDRLDPSDLHWAVGAGLRYRASAVERIHLRLDVALGEDESAVYFSIMEAF